MKIFLVKLGAIGDVLRTTSILPGLKEKYYPAGIDWLTASSAQEILINNPYLNNIFIWEERKELGGYDVVVGLEDDREACELVSGLKAERIIGAYLEEEKERNKIISSATGLPEAGVHSLRHFASIINQCQVVLSSDSLALHFAIALQKRVVAFFGPTSAAEIELYGLGEKVVSCVSCYKKNCDIKLNCMDSLSVDEVFSAVRRQLVK